MGKRGRKRHVNIFMLLLSADILKYKQNTSAKGSCTACHLFLIKKQIYCHMYWHLLNVVVTKFSSSFFFKCWFYITIETGKIENNVVIQFWGYLALKSVNLISLIPVFLQNLVLIIVNRVDIFGHFYRGIRQLQTLQAIWKKLSIFSDFFFRRICPYFNFAETFRRSLDADKNINF